MQRSHHMRFCPPLIIFVAALGVGGSLFPLKAEAHARLRWPIPRNTSDNLKVGPCGTVPTGEVMTELVAGSEVTVLFEETINHPGWFRLAFSFDGDLEFDDQVVLDDIPQVGDTSGGANPAKQYTQSITIPNVSCEACSMQLIQVMTDKPKINGDWQKYFSCADVRILPMGETAEDIEPLDPEDTHTHDEMEDVDSHTDSDTSGDHDLGPDDRLGDSTESSDLGVEAIESEGTGPLRLGGAGGCLCHEGGERPVSPRFFLAAGWILGFLWIRKRRWDTRLPTVAASLSD